MCQFEKVHITSCIGLTTKQVQKEAEIPVHGHIRLRGNGDMKAPNFLIYEKQRQNELLLRKMQESVHTTKEGQPKTQRKWT